MKRAVLIFLVKPFFLPNYNSTPSLHPDSSSRRDTIVCDHRLLLCDHKQEKKRTKANSSIWREGVKYQRTGYEVTRTQQHKGQTWKTEQKDKDDKPSSEMAPKIRMSQYNQRRCKKRSIRAEEGHCWRDEATRGRGRYRRNDDRGEKLIRGEKQGKEQGRRKDTQGGDT